MGSVLPVNPTTLIPIGGIGEETLLLGISNMKLSYEPPPFLWGIGTKKNDWDNKHPSHSHCGYPYNH